MTRVDSPFGKESKVSWNDSQMRSNTSLYVAQHQVPYSFKRFSSRVPSQKRPLRVNDLSTDPVSQEVNSFKLRNTTQTDNSKLPQFRLADIEVKEKKRRQVTQAKEDRILFFE